MIVICCCLGVPLRGQDQHFSMIDLDPMLFNPAYSGFFDGQGRFGAVYRNQWASVSEPFQTVSATAEWAISRSRRNMNGLSAGILLSADRAGTLHYGSTLAAVSLGYFQGLGVGDNIVSLAAEVGVGQTGYSTDGVIFEDPSEQLQHTQVVYPTIGAGVAWFCQITDALYAKVGFSARNINQPDISFLQTTPSRLARHYNAYIRSEWRVVDRWGVLPVVGYQRQDRFNEIIYGCDARYYVRDLPDDFLAFGFGLMMRHNDAASFNANVSWHDLTFAVSYDANISRLVSASRTIGAFEVGIVYLLSKHEARRKAIPCPIF